MRVEAEPARNLRRSRQLSASFRRASLVAKSSSIACPICRDIGRQIERNASFRRHHHQQEQPADTAVSVAERTDGLEMRVRNRHPLVIGLWVTACMSSHRIPELGVDEPPL